MIFSCIKKKRTHKVLFQMTGLLYKGLFYRTFKNQNLSKVLLLWILVGICLDGVPTWFLRKKKQPLVSLQVRFEMKIFQTNFCISLASPFGLRNICFRLTIMVFRCEIKCSSCFVFCLIIQTICEGIKQKTLRGIYGLMFISFVWYKDGYRGMSEREINSLKVISVSTIVEDPRC